MDSLESIHIEAPLLLLLYVDLANIGSKRGAKTLAELGWQMGLPTDFFKS